MSRNTDADVSVTPKAQGLSMGFRDEGIEKLSESQELNFLFQPSLNGKLPSQTKLNAKKTDLRLLGPSLAATGYSRTLDSLRLHSMIIDHDDLVEMDARMTIPAN